MRVWLNGRLVDDKDASISVFDRGFLFGDAVYEVVRLFDGVAVGMDLHTARLRRSLAASFIDGFDASDFAKICALLMEANGLSNGSVYLQVSRGAAQTRLHMPPLGITPTVFACASVCGPLVELERIPSVACATSNDERWHHCEIKTTALLGHLLPMLERRQAGIDEVILFRNGLLSEGCSTNVFVEVGGRLVTPPVDSDPPILHGVMRTRLLESCIEAGVPCDVRPVRQDEVRGSSEIILTASRRIFSAVTTLNGAPVGDGEIGPLARRANAALLARLTRECAPATARTGSTPILAS